MTEFCQMVLILKSGRLLECEYICGKLVIGDTENKKEICCVKTINFIVQR